MGDINQQHIDGYGIALLDIIHEDHENDGILWNVGTTHICLTINQI